MPPSAKLDLTQAIVCDDAPLMYAIPRARDCVFGNTNSVSDSREPSSGDTEAIVSECSRVLGMERPRVTAHLDRAAIAALLDPTAYSGLCAEMARDAATRARATAAELGQHAD